MTMVIRFTPSIVIIFLQKKTIRFYIENNKSLAAKLDNLCQKIA